MNKPAHEIRNGGVKVTIWPKKDTGKAGYTVTISRSYKAGEEWKQTSTFFQSHLAKLAALLAEADEWITRQETAEAAA